MRSGTRLRYIFPSLLLLLFQHWDDIMKTNIKKRPFTIKIGTSIPRHYKLIFNIFYIHVLNLELKLNSCDNSETTTSLYNIVKVTKVGQRWKCAETASAHKCASEFHFRYAKICKIRTMTTKSLTTTREYVRACAKTGFSERAHTCPLYGHSNHWL